MPSSRGVSSHNSERRAIFGWALTVGTKWVRAGITIPENPLGDRLGYRGAAPMPWRICFIMVSCIMADMLS
jgi:hypothetical protein